MKFVSQAAGPQGVTRKSLLRSLFEQFEKAQIPYCLLRDFGKRGGVVEIDLLVDGQQLGRISAILAETGFVELLSWGYHPHYFFVCYDKERDCWLKLDVVADLMYGHPIRCLRVDLVESCLRHRRRSGPLYRPSSIHEFITLFLHCLLDKRSFHPDRVARLRSLWAELQPAQRKDLIDYVSRFVTAGALTEAIETNRWSQLLRNSPAVHRKLFRRNLLRNALWVLRQRALRRLRPFGIALTRRGLCVALLAPDGAGKTTLSRRLAGEPFLKGFPIYMGTNLDATTVGLPTTRFLREHLRSKGGSANQGLLLLRGLNFANRLLEHWYRSAAAACQKLRGRMVIFDRYVYDSVLAPKSRNLGKKLRRWLFEAFSPTPDLVLLLDAPGTILYKRKGEHTPDRLERQRRAYLSLKRRLPGMIVVDATRRLDQVRQEVVSLIWDRYRERFGGRRIHNSVKKH